MMVDHKYTDYSVIDEPSLAFLEEGEEQQATLSDEEKGVQKKKIEKIKRIFGDVGPFKKNSGGVVKPFPEKVCMHLEVLFNGNDDKCMLRWQKISNHFMALFLFLQLMEVLDRSDMESIITWMPHGRAFIVLHPQQLREIVLPRFFKQTKFMSFTRQLNLWGFKRITKGVDSGAYYHELFLRGRPRLAMLMRRQKIKGTGIKLTPNPETEPDFYTISKKRPLPAVDASKKEFKPLPPLRHTNPRGMDAQSSALEYDRMVRRLNNMRHPPQHFDNQIYPFSNSSQTGSSNQLMSQGINQHQMTNMQGMTNMTMPPNMQEVAMRQFLLQQQQQQQQQQQPSNAELFNMLRQRAFMEQQQQQQQAVSSAQQLLSQVGGGGAPSVNDNMQIHELKQRLLNAANSLDHLNQGQQQQPHSSQDMMQLMQQMQPPNLMSPNSGFNPLMQSQQTQSQSQQPNNANIAVLMNALENTRNVAFATQARLQQVTRDLANAQNRQSL